MSVIVPPFSPAKLGAVTINGLGDSIIAYTSNYNIPSIGSGLAPAWAQNTAYASGNVMYNNGGYYTCTTAGTSAASGTGPSGTGIGIVDNTVRWSYQAWQAIKSSHSMLFWAELFSAGRLNWEMSQGYRGTLNGLLRGYVVTGGIGYKPTDTIAFNGGATGTLQVVNGAITGITITNPGSNAVGFNYSLTTSTGSGAVLSFAWGPTGSFGVTGCSTQDMVARLPDVLASTVDIVVVHGGTNDIGNNSNNFAGITANLRICYEAIMAAGKGVIAVPVLPRTGMTVAQSALWARVNRWIRGYCRGDAAFNLNGLRNIVLADPTGYLADGTSIGIAPVGGTGGVSGAMTNEGLHPSNRGAIYIGYTVWQAAQKFFGATTPAYIPRPYSQADGYDPVLNPGGNCLEGQPWQASTAYVQSQLCSNNGNVYVCATAGTSASSGGPTTTGAAIADGSAAWNFVRKAGASVFANGSGGATVAATGITYSGSFANNFYMGRNSGTASGTVAGAIENPWSNGQTGQRQSLAFTLGSGTASDQWYIALASGVYANFGITAADLGFTQVIAEVELELSNVANLTGLYISLFDNATYGWNYQTGPADTGVGQHLLNSAGEMIAWPNNGKLLLRTAPAVLPVTNLTNIALTLYLNFDASGGAGSSTATVKLNTVIIRRSGQA